MDTDIEKLQNIERPSLHFESKLFPIRQSIEDRNDKSVMEFALKLIVLVIVTEKVIKLVLVAILKHYVIDNLTNVCD